MGGGVGWGGSVENSWTCTQAYGHTHTHTHTQTDRQTDRQTLSHPLSSLCAQRLGNLGGLIEQHAQTPLLECSVGGRLGMFSQDLNAEKSINESTGLPINSQQQRASALATNERYVMLDANKPHNDTDNRASRHGGGGGGDDDDDDDDANGLYHLAAPNEG